MSVREIVPGVVFPDDHHPMNKRTDGHPAADLFGAILLAEMRRQAINEVNREEGKIDMPPLFIYKEPFPETHPKSGWWALKSYERQCNCFYCSK